MLLVAALPLMTLIVAVLLLLLLLLLLHIALRRAVPMESSRKSVARAVLV